MSLGKNIKGWFTSDDRDKKIEGLEAQIKGYDRDDGSSGELRQLHGADCDIVAQGFIDRSGKRL